MGGERADNKPKEKEPVKPLKKPGETGVMQFAEQADYALLTGLSAVETDPVTKEIYKELAGYIRQIEREREKIEKQERAYDNAMDKYALIKRYHQLGKYHSKTESSVSETYAEAKVKNVEAFEGIVLLRENFANKDPKNREKRLAVFTSVVNDVLHINIPSYIQSIKEYEEFLKVEDDNLLYMRRNIYIETGDKQYKKYFDESQEKLSAESKQHWDQKIDSSLGPTRPMDMAVAKSINKTFSIRLRQLYESQINDNPVDAYNKCSDFINDAIRMKLGGHGSDLPLRPSNVVVEMMDDYVRKASVLRDDIVRRNPTFADYNDNFVLLVNEAEPFLQSVEMLMKKIQKGEMPSEYLMEKWVYPMANRLLQNQHLQFLKNRIPTLDYAIQTTFPHVEEITDRFSLMLNYCQKLETTARAALEIKDKKTDDFMTAIASLFGESALEKQDGKDVAEITKLIDKIREDYGFQVIYNINGMSEEWKGEETIDTADIKNALEQILQLMSHYPPPLIEYFKDQGVGGNLKNIYITNNLSFVENGEHHACGGLALYNGDIVIDLDQGTGLEWVFNHEFFHQLDHSDLYGKDDPNWIRQNPQGSAAYKYKSGGEAIANADRGFSFSHIVDVFLGKNSEDIEDIKGFARGYGMKGGVDEDQATYAGDLLKSGTLRNLLEKAVVDSVLRKKIEIMTACEYNPATQRFSRLLTEKEYKDTYGYDYYEYYAKWSRDNEGRVWMDHNYWNAVADKKPMTFKHD